MTNGRRLLANQLRSLGGIQFFGRSFFSNSIYKADDELEICNESIGVSNSQIFTTPGQNFSGKLINCSTNCTIKVAILEL
jgi:hypothetical protein